MFGSLKSRGPTRLLAISTLACLGGAAYAQLPGSIFTTKPNGATVNGNIYTDIEDVYLNGGPQNLNAQGMQDGTYFFQVTNPNGRDVLSTTLARHRFIVVNNGRFEGRSDFLGAAGNHMAGGTSITPHKESAGPSPNGGIGVQLFPFDETTNNGGEYKAWVMLYRKDKNPGTGKDYSDTATYSSINIDGYHVDFVHRWAKTDNFKIRPKKNPGEGALSGTKWFDFNMDGVKDATEPPIQGFIIKVILGGSVNTTLTLTTDDQGFWSTQKYSAGTPYKVFEVLPPDAPYGSSASKKWRQTSPGVAGDATEDRGYSGTIEDEDIGNLNFGNTQVIKISGVKFYDRNMDGVYQPDTEIVIPGWQINASVKTPDGITTPYSLTTNSSGIYCLTEVPVYSCYSISEVQGGGGWMQTGPAGNLYSGFISANLVDSDPAIATIYYSVLYNRKDMKDLNFGNILQGKLRGLKFYDTNANSQKDAGEPGIQGFKIVIDYKLPNGTTGQQIVYTNASGDWCSQKFPDGTCYSVYEVLPPSGGWVQTYPSAGYVYKGKIDGGIVTVTPGSGISDVTDLTFGNRVPPPGGAHTKGYWHNQNGYATMNDAGSIVPELQMLNALFLVRLDGSPADFNTANPSAGYADFSEWITNGSNGSNMASQLSSQLAAMKLNVEAGFVAGSQLIYAPGTNSANSSGIAMLSDLLNEANLSLQAFPVTINASAARTHQTALASAIDNGNNNLNWIGLPIVVVPPY
jgi:hypothetical protein